MREVLHDKRLQLAAAVLAGSTMLSGCMEDGTTQSDTQSSTTSVPTTIEAAIEEGKCRIAKAGGDSDCDGTSDFYDKLPGIPDFGDADGDAVPNVLDKYDGTDDKYVDTDADGIPDWLDSVSGPDYADADTDGIIAAFDTDDTVAAQPAQQDTRVLNQGDLTIAYMQNRAMQLALNMDRGYSGPIDTAPELPDPILDAMEIDSDHDHVNDYFDTEPRNPYITPDNDVYDIGSDAWREDQY